ncbi:hypothetical protein BVX94_03445 [bacterium B17]|nr:hypothetical protein BVX94_03445 [bacterium B17]
MPCGIFFHTKFQPGGWPRQGYEAQVNSTHKDPRKTGSVYATKDVGGAISKDYHWFQYEVIVKGKTVTMKVDGKVVNEYTEPDGAKPPKYLSEGTIAIQAHDPGSVVHYRNIMLKVLQ